MLAALSAERSFWAGLDFMFVPGLAFLQVEQATDGPRKGFNPPLSTELTSPSFLPESRGRRAQRKKVAMPQALPANPNLDWLKKTAKQRLAELRADQARCQAAPGPARASPMTMASRAGAR